MASSHPLSAPTDSIMDRLRAYTKPALIVVALGVIGVGGYYMYRQGQQTKAQAADRAYLQAQNSVASGNTPLAQSDLKKIVDRYPGTLAAVQASMLLAQLQYEQGKYADGIATLEKARGSAPKTMVPGLHSLVAAGYEDQQKHDLAAAEYQKAADATPYELDKQKYLADAARSLAAAGKTEEARKIWAQLAEDPTGPTAGEARVRLGELEAKPASRS